MKLSTPGERLDAELAAAGVSQAALAEELGVSPSKVSHWVCGRRKLSLDDVEHIAEFLGIDPAKLAFNPRPSLPPALPATSNDSRTPPSPARTTAPSKRAKKAAA